MRIIDWSSDVCSSDLAQAVAGGRDMSDLFDKLENRRAIIDRRALSARLDEIAGETSDTGKRRRAMVDLLKEALEAGRAEIELRLQIGRASCRERVCQYV